MPFPSARVLATAATALVATAAAVAVWRLRRGWAVITVEGPNGIPVSDAVVPEGKLVLLGDKRRLELRLPRRRIRPYRAAARRRRPAHEHL